MASASSERDDLPALFTELGEVLRARFDGWRASVLAPDVELGFRTGLRLKKKNAARNGAIDVVLLTFDVAPERTLTPRGTRRLAAAARQTSRARSIRTSRISPTASARITNASRGGRDNTR